MSKFGWTNDWKDRASKNLNDAKQNLQNLRFKNPFPVNIAAKRAVGLFSVSDEKVAEIINTVKEKLPTTEALLIGKPQTGKSSIVRGLTGVSAEIIGQGFRPHTKNTERYAYPSEDLPLLIFTDTVGLGDIEQNTQTIVEELGRGIKERKSMRQDINSYRKS